MAELTANEAIFQLQSARTSAEIDAAILQAIRNFTPDANPDVFQEIGVAYGRKNERNERLAKIRHDTVIPPRREPSHDKRERLLTELRSRRANGLDLSGIEKDVKDWCRDSHCGDCSKSLEFQSLCLSFLLECIAVRLKITFIKNDNLNRFGIDTAISSVIRRFVTDPVNTWLDEPDHVYNIGNWLHQEFKSKVEHFQFQPHPKPLRDEAKEFRRHYERIRDMLSHLRSCEISRNA